MLFGVQIISYRLCKSAQVITCSLPLRMKFLRMKLGVKIGALKKTTIHCGIKFILSWIKAEIPLLVNTIAHKDTINSKGFKFVSSKFG